MKRLISVIMILGLMACLWADDNPRTPLPVEMDDAKITSAAVLEQAVARLKRIEQMIYPSLNRQMAADTQHIMNEVYTLLQLLPQDIQMSISKDAASSMLDPNRGAYPAPPRLIERPRPVPERYPIMTEDFNQLLQALEDEAFRRNQLTLLSTATESYRYSVDQIIRLLDALTFSSDKLQALQIVYPGCTDPQNKYRILDSFVMMSDKTRAADIMRRD